MNRLFFLAPCFEFSGGWAFKVIPLLNSDSSIFYHNDLQTGTAGFAAGSSSANHSSLHYDKKTGGLKVFSAKSFECTKCNRLEKPSKTCIQRCEFTEAESLSRSLRSSFSTTACSSLLTGLHLELSSTAHSERFLFKRNLSEGHKCFCEVDEVSTNTTVVVDLRVVEGEASLSNHNDNVGAWHFELLCATAYSALHASYQA